MQQCLEHGLEPRTIGESLLASLRNCFLGAMGVELSHVTDIEKAQIDQINGQTTPADLTEALETLGQALVDMRQAADPRVSLEVALLKLTRTTQPVATPAQPVGEAAPATPVAKASATQKSASITKEVTEAKTKTASTATAPDEAPAQAKPEVKATPASSQGGGDLQSYYQSALEDVSQKVRVRFKTSTYIGSGDNSVQLSSPNEVTQSRCVEVKAELEESLERLAGRSITVEFVESGANPMGKAPSSQTATPQKSKPATQNESEIDLRDLRDADSGSGTSFDRVKQVFPGATVVNEKIS